MKKRKVLKVSGTTDNQLWTEKYQPLRVTELLGQVRIHRQILHVIQNWKKMLLDRSTYPSMYEDAKTPVEQHKDWNRNTLIVWGSSGVGKSTAIPILLRHMGFHVVYISANEETCWQKLKSYTEALQNKSSLDSQNGLRCLVFDSCATAAFSQDMKNCLQILAENARKGVAGKETKSVCFPVIIICDDAYSKWFNPLRRFSKVIHFEASDTKSLSSRVAKIWQWETEHNLDQSILEKLCETAFGDIRWVLNTLQLYSNCAENTHDDFTKEDGLFWFKNISTDNLLQVVTRALDGSSSSMFDHGWGDSLAGMDYEYLLEISPDIAVKVVETNSDLKKLSSTMDIQIECEKSMGRYNHDMTELMRTVGPILISHYANIISRRKVNLLDKINNRRLSIQNMKKNTKTLQELRKSLPASHWNVGNNQLIMETLPILCSILDHYIIRASLESDKRKRMEAIEHITNICRRYSLSALWLQDSLHIDSSLEQWPRSWNWEPDIHYLTHFLDDNNSMQNVPQLESSAVLQVIALLIDRLEHSDNEADPHSKYLSNKEVGFVSRSNENDMSEKSHESCRRLRYKFHEGHSNAILRSASIETLLFSQMRTV